MINYLGQSPISTAKKVGLDAFSSIFVPKVSTAYAGSRNFRRRTLTRGILIDKRYLERTPIDLNKGYSFQFNPGQLTDFKSTEYEVRPYSGLAYNDYIWSNGGERMITFQLFLDDTPASHYSEMNPSTTARSIQNTGTVNDKTANFTYNNTGAYSNSRIHERGTLETTDLLQSFLYPQTLDNENIPKFAEGGVISMNQFRPPATAVFSFGPIYLEGVVKTANVTHTLFDSDLTPIRSTVDVEFAVFEFENLVKRIL